MAAAPYILLALGTVAQAGSAMRQAQTQAMADNYNAQLDEQNAGIAEAQGNAAAEAQARDSQRKIGAMVAAYGGSGTDVSTGSAIDVLADSARQASLDTLTIKYNAKLRAAGYSNQAKLSRFSATDALSAGRYNSTAALLQGASKAGGYSGGSTIPETG